ncbi:kexin [Cryptococcus neoformans Tu259-1]|uniref:Kexin n=1 Tax=Cryptococcus neoformans Tu259-1 TaxID=1230072 RepID=A0A854QA77_CRYNE|nr:kexin [Cryptococcus neoformans var. grubii AD1-83a]OWZ49984.1 kexin [Cryptococcus neoformans var. grubii 125.91]OXG10327.1 kexin [Cryptococcus neoformans var. grubii Tu259-1]OXG42961.1 kexin [Cryptococcus neoformans var. grubii MW-RSA1955]OXG47222.1 kexin [Cryptococcus neoformans var. grubii CHC193]OXG56173.1 kexin [Cryptococcus neoformans var. grubii c8]OXH00879.1 kexin [Cryptococcus neoformans var. grubii A5-35-17]OXH02149.1 kexin [Cryptococcus neoformans var. grubii A1-35-8]
MRLLLSLWGILLVLIVPPSLALQTPQPRSYDTHTYYALELDPSTSPAVALQVSKSLGVELVERIGELDGHWLVRTEGWTPEHASITRRSASHDPVLKRWEVLPSSLGKKSLTPLSLKQRVKRHKSYFPRSLHSRDDRTELLYAQNELHLADPMLDQQWHLINTQMKDIELNVTGLWGRGVTGEGVHVVIIDDGLDVESKDLKDNFFAEGSYDFNDHTALPIPRLRDDQHGTRCAGEIAAVPNDVCGVGVAYGSKIAGVRILSAPISDADEAAALNYAYQLNDIYSCSWGPPDDGRSMEAPDGLILKAMVNGVQKGRDGKGSVFVFAAGNGGGSDDQCNFDGYTNSIFSVTVGAVDRKGLHPYYSEMCAAMMVVAPSSGSGDHIHTTDVGKDKCAHNHGGTSAAAPLAVGVFALALSVRPDLTWRDIQHLAVRHAVFFNPDDPAWELTAAGRNFSYKYGYGKLDAGLFVEAAEKWELVKPQTWYDSPAVYLPTTSPADVTKRQDGAAHNTSSSVGETPNSPPVVEPSGSFITEDGVTSTYEVTQSMLYDANFERLEHVTVRVWIDHQRRGDVEVELISPNGVVSVLCRQRRFDDANSGFPGWKFMSLKHWDENPVGTWVIKVKDQVNPDKTGRFVAWSLQLWGESVDPALAKLWAPAEEGEPDEEQTGSDPSTTVNQKPKPTQLLPGDHGEASGEANQPGLASATTHPQPTGTAGEGGTIAEPTSPTDADADEGFFSGISNLASSSTWLAGAGAIIILSGAAIGAFFFIRARRQRRNLFGLSNNGQGARGAYEPVDDVQMSLLERGRRKFGKSKSQSQGTKDLYDAFGDGPSDDEEEDLDERTALRYHDGFLEDDELNEEGPKTEYKDEPEPETFKDGEEAAETKDKGKGKGPSEGESGSGSSSSWQDAAEEEARV